MGGGGGMAGRLVRGEVRMCTFAASDKRRPVVVLTRESAIGHLATITVAPITSSVRDAPSHILLDERDGMKHLCAVNLHHIVSVLQEQLGKRIVQLAPARMAQICTAARFCIGCGTT